VCFNTIQSFVDGYKITPAFGDKSKLKIGNSRNNLWIIDPSDRSANIAEEITEKEKKLIKSEASKALNNIRNENYSFLHKKNMNRKMH
jgi:hypothetical protein